jgi:hypothetical protein
VFRELFYYFRELEEFTHLGEVTLGFSVRGFILPLLCHYSTLLHFTSVSRFINFFGK